MCGACDIMLIDSNCLLMRMSDHDLVLKDFVLYPVPGITNENHEYITFRIAVFWAKFSNPRPREYEAEAPTT
jgi:hypothetical protein